MQPHTKLPDENKYSARIRFRFRMRRAPTDRFVFQVARCAGISRRMREQFLSQTVRAMTPTRWRIPSDINVAPFPPPSRKLGLKDIRPLAIADQAIPTRPLQFLIGEMDIEARCISTCNAFGPMSDSPKPEGYLSWIRSRPNRPETLRPRKAC